MRYVAVGHPETNVERTSDEITPDEVERIAI
jgi:hypothetical protein